MTKRPLQAGATVVQTDGTNLVRGALPTILDCADIPVASEKQNAPFRLDTSIIRLFGYVVNTLLLSVPMVIRRVQSVLDGQNYKPHQSKTVQSLGFLR